MRAARADLDGDGVSGRLYEILWKRDLLSDTSLAVRIPDTVVFKYNVPSLWYFTSVDGTIKRKSKAKCTCEHIEKEFTKRPSPSGIVAYYAAAAAAPGLDDLSKLAATGEASAGEAGGEAARAARTTIEYLDAAGLHKFLFEGSRRLRSDGVLQRFVEPKGESNTMLRALWSPKVCLLERRINCLRLSETRYDMYERAVTFEGPDFHSVVAPVRGSGMMARVQEVAEAIVEHVAAVTNERIHVSRLTLCFKVDRKERLHLLFASSVRLQEELRTTHAIGVGTVTKQPLEVGVDLGLPAHVRRVASLAIGRPVALQMRDKCPCCEATVAEGSLYDVAYKVLVESAEAEAAKARPAAAVDLDMRGVDDGVFASELPEALRRLHPRLSLEEYASLRHDVVFLSKTKSICEVCFLRYSEPLLGVRSAPVGAADVAVGTQGLNPEPLRNRQRATLSKVRAQQARENGFEDTHWQRLHQAKEDKTAELRRAESCPRLLPSWGPKQTGPVLWPPAPVLSHRPRVVERACSLAPLRPQPLSPPAPAAPPPRGLPYLRGLQTFVSHCPSRAKYVLPHAYSECMAGKRGCARPRRTDDASRHPAHAAPAAPAAPEEAQTSATSAAGVFHLLPASSASGAGSVQEDFVSEGIRETYDDVLDGDASEGDEPALAKLWGHWPPSVGITPASACGGADRATAASTRVPSGQGSRPSTRGGTSTRPSSAAFAAGPGLGGPGARAFAQSAAAAPGRRPSSSPLAHRQGSGHSALLRPSSSGAGGAETRMLRPQSSPHLRGGEAARG